MNKTETTKKHIFISYAREDYEVAEKLYNDLDKVGLNPWLDRKKLLVGQNWKIEIDKAIRKSSFFCALLSSNSVTKIGHVQKELKKALDILDNYPGSEIFLLPIRLDDCSPRDEKLHDIHWADLFPSYDQGLKEILRVLDPVHECHYKLDDILKQSYKKIMGNDSKKTKKNQPKKNSAKILDNKSEQKEKHKEISLFKAKYFIWTLCIILVWLFMQELYFKFSSKSPPINRNGIFNSDSYQPINKQPKNKTDETKISFKSESEPTDNKVLNKTLYNYEEQILYSGLHAPRTIAFVYDDSMSMWGEAGKKDQQHKWVYVNFAAQAITSLLRENDRFIAIKMSDLKVTLLAACNQSSIDLIRQTWIPQKATTPYEAVEKAMNEILKSVNLREGSIDEQKQDILFVTTDGIFGLNGEAGMQEQDWSQVRENAFHFLKQTRGKVRIFFFLIGETADRKIPKIWQELAPYQVLIFNVEPPELFNEVRKAAAMMTGHDLQIAEIQKHGRMIQFSTLFPVRRVTILEQNFSGQLATVSNVISPERQEVIKHQNLIRMHPNSKANLSAKVTHCKLSILDKNNNSLVMPQGKFNILFEQNLDYHDINVFAETAVDFQLIIKKDVMNYCLNDPLILSINFFKAGTRDPLKLTRLNTENLIAKAIFGKFVQEFKFNSFGNTYNPVSFKVMDQSNPLFVEAKYPGYFYLKSNVFEIIGNECVNSIRPEKIDMNIKYTFSDYQAAGKNEFTLEKLLSGRFIIAALSIPEGISIQIGQNRLSSNTPQLNNLQCNLFDSHNRLPFTVYNNRHYKDSNDASVVFKFKFPDEEVNDLQTTLILKPVDRKIKIQTDSRLIIPIENLGEQAPFKIRLTADDVPIDEKELSQWSFSVYPLSKRLRVAPIIKEKSQILIKPIPWLDFHCAKCFTSSGTQNLIIDMTGPFPKEKQLKKIVFVIKNDNHMLTFFKVCMPQITMLVIITIFAFIFVKITSIKMKKNNQSNTVNNNSVFISYNHNDKIISEKIKNELEKAGFQVIIDVDSMKTGKKIETFIMKCIRESKCTLVIVSSNSLLSAWVALEIIYSKYESEQRDHYFMPCIIDSSIFDREFTSKTLNIIRNEIKDIDKIIDRRTKIDEGFEDLQDERTRLRVLQSNLPIIIGKLKNEFCIDLSKENFNNGIKKIIEDLHSYQNKTLFK